ncbi:FAD-binding monooxygenase [Catellatospora sp. TT07R-123]|uniref:FAD-dependent oxidoreductase n=1 Tax=Catellatospora sp. TT07R-123 TaxID=2733863 RepID=UPI001B09F0F2|nr:FAD-binding monooxygenase [Catellatospora sp. TT07R-123]GHJ44212.1 FAD-binding monooxygenase [Catellatospora sp. TT07R-123]
MSDRSRAVVLGGSIAGLFAARVLSELYDEVLVVDRDRLLGVDGPRRGRPQGRHINAMHVKGRLVMEDLFPGITEELMADECPSGDFVGSVRWYFHDKPLKREDIGYIAVPVTAPLLEQHIRERTSALPNVSFLEERDIVGLTATPDRSRITGVRVQRQETGSREEAVTADLVVDATGRGSRTPVWLEQFGYPKVEEDRIKVDLMYATQHYEIDGDPLDGELAIIPVASPERPRGAIFTKTDHGKWELTVYGLLGDHPPTDQEGYFEFVKSLSTQDIYDAVRYAKPLDEPVSYRYPTTIRRRYERMSSLPLGLLVTGDAVTSFNPVYAQGMTVAALSALALRDHLRAAPETRPLEYFRDLARDVIDAPWGMTSVVDLSFPEVEGERPFMVKMQQAYLNLVQAAATRDTAVTTAYMRAAGMMDRPEALMRPGMVLRVLAKSIFGGPSAEEPTRASAGASN